jgi:aspartyl-tRNA(Asn)/glutamyl-tRNA(Gln) amidotransferase subunit A
LQGRDVGIIGLDAVRRRFEADANVVEPALFQPSAGHVARIDGVPAMLTDFETIGTLTHSIDDALLLDAAMAGRDPRHRRSLYADRSWGTGAARILYIPSFDNRPVDPAVAKPTDRVANALVEAGHIVLLEQVFFDLGGGRIWRVISRAGLAWLVVRERRKARRASRSFGSLHGCRWGDNQRGGICRCTGMGCGVQAAVRRALRACRHGAHANRSRSALAAETAYPDRLAGRPAGPRDHAIFSGWVNIAAFRACPSLFGHRTSDRRSVDGRIRRRRRAA